MTVEVELHDEVVKWLDALSDEEWGRVVVIVDRLADLGPSCSNAALAKLG
jgi:hypothetical protein